MDKSIFIKLLEHGEEVGLSGTNFEHVKDWAFANHIISDSSNSENEISLLRDLYFECFTRSSHTTEDIWVLKTEYFFRLLEYRELYEARKSSKQANRNSLFAISISIIALLASIMIGFQQLTGEVKINAEQIATINRHIEAQSLSINSIINNGFSAVLNSMEIQKTISSKNSEISHKADMLKGDPNQTNTAAAKSRAAD